jgi:disulfide bond formation protein DsbB
MRATLTRGTRGPALIALASFVVVGAAVASQVWGGLSPCKLCWYQRYPYALTIVLGIAGLVLAGRGANRGAALLSFWCGVAFLLGAAVAAFHVGVEQGWWVGSTACTGGGAGQARSVDELRQMLETAPVVRCDEVQWSLFGVSMAGYNLLVSIGLTAFAALTARTLERRRP